MTDFVAVSDIRFGDVDDAGKVTNVAFSRGEDVTEGTDEQLHEWLMVGSIAVKDSAEDPNTWPAPVGLEYHTTPAVVQAALEVQVLALNSPLGKESDTYQGALTQPVDDDHVHPESPADLLVNDNHLGGKSEEATPSKKQPAVVPAQPSSSN